MKASELKGKIAKDQYRDMVTILDIVDNTVLTNNGRYHVSKLFINGKSIQIILS